MLDSMQNISYGGFARFPHEWAIPRNGAVSEPFNGSLTFSYS